MCTCVRFGDSNGNMFFGRNLDWSSSFGQKVVIAPRNYSYKSAFLGEQSPKHGAIIGMGIVVENTPLYFDCANEDGLCIAGLNFAGFTSFAPDAIDGKNNVAQYEFPLWVAMNFGSVDEVEEVLKDTVIVAKPINDNYPASQLHYMIGDAKRSIVVEFTEKGAQIFHNDVDVLTNQPGYDWHKENLRNYMNAFPNMPAGVKWGNVEIAPFGGGSLMRGIPGDYSSTSRFIKIAYLNTHYPVKNSEEENVVRLFRTLSSVAMIEGASQMSDGKSEITTYTSGYSSVSKTYFYSTYEDSTIRSVKLDDHDLNTVDLVQV